MGTVTITVDEGDAALRKRFIAAFEGKAQGESITFKSIDLLWETLAPNRMALVKALVGAGPVSIREAARRVGRDVRAVHADVHRLLNAGVLLRTADGQIEFPHTGIHLDVRFPMAA